MIRGVIIGLFCVVLPTNLVFGAAGQQQNKKYGEKEVAEAKNTDEGRLQYDYDRDKPNKWKINGTFRYLYGQGRLEGKSLGKYYAMVNLDTVTFLDSTSLYSKLELDADDQKISRIVKEKLLIKEVLFYGFRTLRQGRRHYRQGQG